MDASLDDHSLDAGKRREILVAVTEACSNVVVHAYRAGAAGSLDVAVQIADGRIVVIVRDNGGGIRPRADSPGLGQGLSVIATLADTVQLRDLGPGAEVRMTFNLATTPR